MCVRYFVLKHAVGDFDVNKTSGSISFFTELMRLSNDLPPPKFALKPESTYTLILLNFFSELNCRFNHSSRRKYSINIPQVNAKVFRHADRK